MAMPSCRTSLGCFLIAYLTLSGSLLLFFVLDFDPTHTEEHKQRAPLRFAHHVTSASQGDGRLEQRDIEEITNATASELSIALSSLFSAMRASPLKQADEVILFATRIPLFDRDGGDLRVLKLAKSICALDLTVRFVAMQKWPNTRLYHRRALESVCPSHLFSIHRPNDVPRLVDAIRDRHAAVLAFTRNTSLQVGEMRTAGDVGQELTVRPRGGLLAAIYHTRYLNWPSESSAFTKFARLIRARLPDSVAIVARDEVMWEKVSRARSQGNVDAGDAFSEESRDRDVVSDMMKDEKVLLSGCDYAIMASESDVKAAAQFTSLPQSGFGVVRFAYEREDGIVLNKAGITQGLSLSHQSPSHDAAGRPRIDSGMPGGVGSLGSTSGDRSFAMDFESRVNLLYLGAGSGNSDSSGALTWFVVHVLPIVRASLPAIGVDVIGGVQLRLPGFSSKSLSGDENGKKGKKAAGQPDVVAGAAGVDPRADGVTLIGHVDDLTRPMGMHRVFLSPMRNGGGLTTKNVVAIAHGLPVVTTSIGALGLPHAKGATLERALELSHRYLLPFIVADTPADFARATIALYTNKDLWTHLHRNCQLYARGHFADEHGASDVANAIAAGLRRNSERAVARLF